MTSSSSFAFESKPHSPRTSPQTPYTNADQPSILAARLLALCGKEATVVAAEATKNSGHGGGGGDVNVERRM